jgi:hypothetical protein
MKTRKVLTFVIVAWILFGFLWSRYRAKDLATSAIYGGSAAAPVSLADARSGFATKLTEQIKGGEPVEVPPKGVFDLVHYDSAVGPLAAYLTSDPQDGRKHPAIIWITGGDCNSIGEVWFPAPADNDQTASAYRQAGIVMMFPSLRGGNQNPGVEEKFFGEVDDVVAAAHFLAAQPFVDPNRIYLGGHSTGGTLVLLVSECTDIFRSVFSFGPVDNVTGYGRSIELPFDRSDNKEVGLRSPMYWLRDVKAPTFVFEGSETPSNATAVRLMSQRPASALVHFYIVQGMTHFSILAPANQLIAKKIVQDDGAAADIQFADNDISAIGQ